MTIGVIAALAVVIFVAIVLLAPIVWSPLKGVPRDKFGHWIESLMRYYEDSASLCVTSPSRLVSFRFLRARSRGDGCELVLEIPNSALASDHRSELVDEIRRRGYEPGVCPDKGLAFITAEIEVPNIWNPGSGNHAARLVHAALDVMGFDRSQEFNLSFDGSRSRSRTLEARKRLDPDSLIG